MRKPLPFKTALHYSNLLLTSSLVSATNTISLANNILHGIVTQIDFEISSIMTVKIKELSAIPNVGLL